MSFHKVSGSLLQGGGGGTLPIKDFFSFLKPFDPLKFSKQRKKNNRNTMPLFLE